MSRAANSYQCGGNHYSKGGNEQHWDRMWRLYREAWFVGNVTKYVERYRKKDGVKDLEKAKHYLEKLIELEKENSTVNCRYCAKRFKSGDIVYQDGKVGNICEECYKQQTPTEVNSNDSK